MLRAILDRAKANREIREDTDLDCAVSMLVGAFYAAYLADSRVPPALPRNLVETLWVGIRRPGAKALEASGSRLEPFSGSR
jgi:hypothetical protein